MKKAVAKGYTIGYNGLGYAYLEGAGVKPNATTAVEYYKQAVTSGDS